MADDDAVIRRRLLTRTSALGKSGVKKVAEGLLALLDALADDGVDAPSCKRDMDALLWEMEQLEFEANKTDIWSFTCQRELEEYEKLNADIDASIGKVSREIEELKAKVQVERTIRAYKEEYESISRVVNQLPSRREINAEIDIERKRLAEATEVIENVDRKLDLRTKQFALLMATIQNLKATLDEDVQMEDEEEEEDNQQLQHRQADTDDDEDMERPGSSRRSTPGPSENTGADDEEGLIPDRSPSTH